MLENLRGKIQKVLQFIGGFGKLTEENIKEASRQLRLALLEADVHFTVVKEFTEAVKAKAMGAEVLASMSPGRTFLGIVYEELLALLGKDRKPFIVYPDRTVKIILFGANGSGKTTTAVKLAVMHKDRNPLIVAGDLTRPAAIDQLEILCRENSIALFSDRQMKDPEVLFRKAADTAASHGLVIYDTAGRFDTDSGLMRELKQAVDQVRPDYKVLVIDAAEGQKGIDLVRALQEQVGIDHIILSKMDSDARGGLALSVRHLTRIPVAFMTTGERVKDIEAFDPEVLAKRIMSVFEPDLKLLEKVKEQIESEELAEPDLKRFDLEQFMKGLSMLRKGDILSSIMKSIPGLEAAGAPGPDLKEVDGFRAIISSMTPQERRNPDIIDFRRRLRIARGCGHDVKDVNILMKRFDSARQMMKKFKNRKNPAMNIEELMSQFRRR
jgi:signal recognition particle subunit SRP54